jgi:hypothetical protein
MCLQAYARDHTELVGVKKGSWGHTAAFDAAWTKIESKVRPTLYYQCIVCYILYISTRHDGAHQDNKPVLHQSVVVVQL